MRRLLVAVEDIVGLLLKVFHLHLVHVHQVQLVEFTVADLRRPLLLLDHLDFPGQQLDHDLVVLLSLPC